MIRQVRGETRGHAQQHTNNRETDTNTGNHEADSHLVTEDQRLPNSSMDKMT